MGVAIADRSHTLPHVPIGLSHASWWSPMIRGSPCVARGSLLAVGRSEVRLTRRSVSQPASGLQRPAKQLCVENVRRARHHSQAVCVTAWQRWTPSSAAKGEQPACDLPRYPCRWRKTASMPPGCASWLGLMAAPEPGLAYVLAPMKPAELSRPARYADELATGGAWRDLGNKKRRPLWAPSLPGPRSPLQRNSLFRPCGGSTRPRQTAPDRRVPATSARAPLGSASACCPWSGLSRHCYRRCGNG